MRLVAGFFMMFIVALTIGIVINLSITACGEEVCLGNQVTNSRCYENKVQFCEWFSGNKPAWRDRVDCTALGKVCQASPEACDGLINQACCR